jgi:hypothetical protein
MYNKVTLVNVDNKEDNPYPIKIKLETGCCIILTKYGQYTDADFAKCVIYPKGKTTWEGFHKPFKDGDIVATEHGVFIGIAKVKNNIQLNAYCAIDEHGSFAKNINYGFERLATEEEKQKLFDAIKANGYKWNEETKTLEKLVKPRFKVGDRITTIYGDFQYDIKEVTDTHYTLVEVEYKFKYTEPIIEDKNWELVKFDFNTLKPFDKVLARCSTLDKWRIQLFEKYDKTSIYPFICMGYNKYKECIPYEGNEHLLDTTDDCDEYYKTY